MRFWYVTQDWATLINSLEILPANFTIGSATCVGKLLLPNIQGETRFMGRKKYACLSWTIFHTINKVLCRILPTCPAIDIPTLNHFRFIFICSFLCLLCPLWMEKSAGFFYSLSLILDPLFFSTAIYGRLSGIHIVPLHNLP